MAALPKYAASGFLALRFLTVALTSPGQIKIGLKAHYMTMCVANGTLGDQDLPAHCSQSGAQGYPPSELTGLSSSAKYVAMFDDAAFAAAAARALRRSLPSEPFLGFRILLAALRNFPWTSLKS